MQPRPQCSAGEHDLERAALEAVGRATVKIPPYPAVAQRVSEAARDVDLGLDQVSRIISADAALAADVLRCANSAFYRRGSAVTTLRNAVTRIGGREVMRIAVAASLGAYARAAGPLSPVRRRIWVDNLAAAVVCQELGRLRRGRSEEAFLVGLLHDFGKVVAVAAIESVLQRADDPGAVPAGGWGKLIERLHVPLGRTVSAAWQLPPPIAEAIALHHQSTPPVAHGDLLATVRATDEVVDLLATSPGVTTEDLERVPGLSERERAPVARVIELLPELIAAFEAVAPQADGRGERERLPPAGATPGPSAPPAAGASPGPRPPPGEAAPAGAALTVTIGAPRRPREYRVAEVTPDSLRIVGQEALPESRLINVEVWSPAGPLSMWTLIEESQREGGPFTAALRPFALSGRERSCWEALVAAAPCRRAG